MAHVTKRNGRWQATYRDPAKRERTRTFDKKVDAEKWIATNTADIARGQWVDAAAGRVTVAAYAKAWLERMTPTWRASTAATVRNSLDRHVMPVLGARPVSAVRRSDVEALCASLELAPGTVATIHQHLGQMLASAVDDGLIMRNPATRARLPKREPAKAQPVPLEVVEAIRVNLPEWMRVVVPLGLGLGLRQGELSGLTVDRVDFLRRTLRVDRQLVSRHVDVPGFAPPKTASSHRTVPMADFVIDALAAHLREHPAGPGGYVVAAPDGRPLDSDLFGYWWRRACQAAGATGVGYHGLRHTFASTLLSRGVSVKAVADWLGHASPAITLTTYAHLMPADENTARAVLSDAFADKPRTAATNEQVSGGF